VTGSDPRERRVQSAALAFLSSGAGALACFLALQASALGWIRPLGFAFDLLQLLLCAVATLSAAVYLFVSRGKRTPVGDEPAGPARFGRSRVLRLLAWIAIVVCGVWVGFVVVSVAAMAIYYDGSY
jgi:hypothetical protein